LTETPSCDNGDVDRFGSKLYRTVNSTVRNYFEYSYIVPVADLWGGCGMHPPTAKCYFLCPDNSMAYWLINVKMGGGRRRDDKE
jgi:hypothetical protein